MSNQENVMRSVYTIRKQFASFFEKIIPIYVEHAMNEWSDPPNPPITLPKRYDAVDPYEVDSDDYPCIGVTILRSDNYQRLDFSEDGSPEYQSVHLCQIFIAQKTRYLMVDDEGFDQYERPPRSSVIDRRDELTGIVANVLLAYPDLTVNNEDSPIVMDESTLQITFVDPMKTGDPNVWVAVSQIGLSLKLREIAWVPPLSVVHKAIARTQVMGN